ncbi:MAG: hypothetical protein U0X93_07900 [Anaerolineales bacterium]
MNHVKVDQVIAYLRANGKQQVIDLRPALLAAKSERQVYYATDTHWNDYGAYIAYSAIMNELRKTNPNLIAHPASDFEPVSRDSGAADLAAVMGVTTLLRSRSNLRRCST